MGGRSHRVPVPWEIDETLTAWHACGRCGATGPTDSWNEWFARYTGLDGMDYRTCGKPHGMEAGVCPGCLTQMEEAGFLYGLFAWYFSSALDEAGCVHVERSIREAARAASERVDELLPGSGYVEDEPEPEEPEEPEPRCFYCFGPIRDEPDVRGGRLYHPAHVHRDGTRIGGCA